MTLTDCAFSVISDWAQLPPVDTDFSGPLLSREDDLSERLNDLPLGGDFPRVTGSMFPLPKEVMWQRNETKMLKLNTAITCLKQ